MKRFYKPELTPKSKLEIQMDLEEAKEWEARQKTGTTKFTKRIPHQVYSPQLQQVFTPTEIKGNAIYTVEGACVSCKLVTELVPVPVPVPVEIVNDNQIDKTVNLDHED